VGAVGKIDLMKKGLRRDLMKSGLNSQERSSERLTWWKRDCDGSFLPPTTICPQSSRKDWPDEKGIATTVQREFVSRRLPFYPPSERLTWWKRDCDLKCNLPGPKEYVCSRKDWPDEKGIATHHITIVIWNTPYRSRKDWPDEKGIATISLSYSKPCSVCTMSERLTWWKRDCDGSGIGFIFGFIACFVGKIDLMKKGLRPGGFSGVSSIRPITCVGKIDLMKKGLRLGRYFFPTIWLKSRKDWPDEKGIATWITTKNILETLYSRKDWPDEKGIATLFMGIMRSLPPLPSERLTWWKRDCDLFLIINFYLRNIASERLTWWKRDCDSMRKN